MWDPFGFLYSAYLRGLAYLQAENGKAAAAQFEKVIDNHGLVANFIVGALAHLQLARVYAMLGDKAAARKSYQEFLTLWEESDSGIPIYQLAKAEYKKLN